MVAFTVPLWSKRSRAAGPLKQMWRAGGGQGKEGRRGDGSDLVGWLRRRRWFGRDREAVTRFSKGDKPLLLRDH